MINGAKVKRLRTTQGKTQREVATDADITEVTLSTIENGHNKTPSMLTVGKLAVALGVKPGELMKDW